MWYSLTICFLRPLSEYTYLSTFPLKETTGYLVQVFIVSMRLPKAFGLTTLLHILIYFLSDSGWRVRPLIMWISGGEPKTLRRPPAESVCGRHFHCTSLYLPVTKTHDQRFDPFINGFYYRVRVIKQILPFKSLRISMSIDWFIFMLRNPS